MTTKVRAKVRDVEEKSAIYDGMSISALADIFGMDKRKVSALLRHVKPSSMRSGFPIYHLKEAARYLVEPVVDVEEYIKKLRPNDLPPFLQKEFWAAQLSKQKYELTSGTLWPTEDVMAVFADVFKKVKTGVLLFHDTVEAKTDLTEKQRQIILSLSDGLLEDLHRILVDGELDGESSREKELQELE